MIRQTEADTTPYTRAGQCPVKLQLRSEFESWTSPERLGTSGCTSF